MRPFHGLTWVLMGMLALAVAGCSLTSEVKDIAPDARIASSVSAPGTLDLRAVSQGVHLLGVAAENPGPIGGITGLSLAFGDFNGDGKKDLAVGAPSLPPELPGEPLPSGAGGVYILFGRSSLPTLNQLPALADLTLVANYSSTGYSLLFDDVNGDGLDDLIVGAPWAEGFVPLRRQSVGVVSIVFGRKGLTGAHPLGEVADIAINGANNFDFSGASLAKGDFNGDGLADLLIGAPLAVALGTFERGNSGAAYLLLGRRQWPKSLDLAEDASIRFFGVASGDRAGTAVALSDVTGDGLDDIVIGAPLANWMIDDRPYRKSCGAVYLVKGRKELPEFVDLAKEADSTMFGTESGDGAGWSLVVGDFNGDGKGDIVIGAPLARHSNARRKGDIFDLIGGNWRAELGLASARNRVSGHAEGEVHVLFGRAEWSSLLDLASQASLTLYGLPFDESLEIYLLTRGGGDAGYSLALGNIDGDNKKDLIIGAPFADGTEPFRSDAGMVHVVLGSDGLVGAAGLADASAYRFIGSKDRYRLGTSVAVGDFNGDGTDELAMAEPRASEVDEADSVRGRVYLIDALPEKSLFRPQM